MNRIDKRLKGLERQTATDEEGRMKGIFFVTVDCSQKNQPPQKIIGWKYKEQSIMRVPGESDEELKSRAIETVKLFLRKDQVPSFFTIY